MYVCVCIIKFSSLTIFQCTSQWHKYVGNFVQPPLLSVAITFSPSQREILHPLKSNSPFPSPPTPGKLGLRNSCLLSAAMNLPILGTNRYVFSNNFVVL